MAAEAGLDLVENRGKFKTPCLQNFGTHGKFKLPGPEKKLRKPAKSRRPSTSKEIKMRVRPNIDIHDYEVKMRSVNRILERATQGQGNPMRFRGREMAHQELGICRF